MLYVTYEVVQLYFPRFLCKIYLLKYKPGWLSGWLDAMSSF